MTTRAISAKEVAELRARTGAGMMDCKAALEEAQGDMERAVEILRKKGIAKAERRAERGASQGLVVLESGADARAAAMIELNCETDFVARNEEFIALGRDLARHVLQSAPDGVHLGATIEHQSFRGKTVGEVVKEISGKTGEAMSFRRFAKFGPVSGAIGSYLHFTGQVGVLVELEGPAGGPMNDLARELTLHIASADPQPLGVVESDLDADLVARERRIAEEQVAQEGKPENIRPKIVEGKVRKFVGERTLLGQPFVKDDKKSVAELVKEAGKQAGGPITVKRFARFKVGDA